MKVLHCPHNVSGQATVLSYEQRLLGHEPFIATFRDPMRFSTDLDLGCERRGLTCLYRVARLFESMGRYDVIHYYYDTLFPARLPFIGGRDLEYWSKRGKATVMQFCGCDVRRNCGIPCGMKCDERVKEKRIENARKHAGAVVYPIPELLDFGEWIPYAIDLNYWKPFTEKKEDKEPLVAHFPTHSAIKGTSLISKAVRNVGASYMSSMMPWYAMRNALNETSILVDQLHTEWYGTIAAEAMAMNTVVLAPIREDLEDYATGCPVVRVTPENLEEKLEELLEDEKLRSRLARLGRKYAERVHDSKKIASEVARLYDQ